MQKDRLFSQAASCYVCAVYAIFNLLTGVLMIFNITSSTVSVYRPSLIRLVRSSFRACNTSRHSASFSAIHFFFKRQPSHLFSLYVKRATGGKGTKGKSRPHIEAMCGRLPTVGKSLVAFDDFNLTVSVVIQPILNNGGR